MNGGLKGRRNRRKTRIIGFAEPIAGIIDNDIDPAKDLTGATHGVRHRLLIGQIGLQLQERGMLQHITQDHPLIWIRPATADRNHPMPLPQ